MLFLQLSVRLAPKWSISPRPIMFSNCSTRRENPEYSKIVKDPKQDLSISPGDPIQIIEKGIIPLNSIQSRQSQSYNFLGIISMVIMSDDISKQKATPKLLIYCKHCYNGTNGDGWDTFVQHGPPAVWTLAMSASLTEGYSAVRAAGGPKEDGRGLVVWKTRPELDVRSRIGSSRCIVLS